MKLEYNISEAELKKILNELLQKYNNLYIEERNKLEPLPEDFSFLNPTHVKIISDEKQKACFRLSLIVTDMQYHLMGMDNRGFDEKQKQRTINYLNQLI